MKVSMKNDAGLVRQVKVGFSWTSFFFGAWPFFFRGMAMRGILWLILGCVTVGISNIFLMFMINEKTAHYYLENGYKPFGAGWDTAGRKWGVTASPVL